MARKKLKHLPTEKGKPGKKRYPQLGRANPGPDSMRSKKVIKAKINWKKGRPA